MPPHFSETVAAFLAKRELAASLLVHMDFRVTPKRWWMGYGNLEAGSEIWQGTGDLISVDGLDQSIGTAAPQTTFTLSGVGPDIVTLARSASDRVKDRRVTVFVQFFDISPNDARKAPWSKLDTPYAVYVGRMDQMRYSAQGSDKRTVTVTAEGLWANRNKPPFGLYTDRDQQARSPGDRGLEGVAALVTKTIEWPS